MRHEFKTSTKVTKRSTFVVLYPVSVPVVSSFFPFLKFWQWVEGNLSAPFGSFDDGCDELFHERAAQQSGPVVVDKVDQQTLDVGAILETPQS